MKRVMALIFMTVTAAPTLAATATPLGVWRVTDGSVNVDIRRCGKDLCGTAGGKPVFVQMHPTADHHWVGVINDSRSGDKYDGTIGLINADQLQVHGCLPGGGMCGDQTWTRVK